MVFIVRNEVDLIVDDAHEADQYSSEDKPHEAYENMATGMLAGRVNPFGFQFAGPLTVVASRTRGCPRAMIKHCPPARI